MLKFIFRRITFILAVFIFIVFAVQLGMGMIDNSERSMPDFDMVAQTKAAWRDTRAYVRSIFSGNLGTVEGDRGPVQIMGVLREAYANSMGLMFASITGGALLGLSIGAFIALRKHNKRALALLTATIFGISTPSFFAGLLLRQGELAYLNVFGHPLVSVAGLGWDYRHMLLPGLVLAARPLAYLARASFLSLSNAMDEDYIRTAYSKGLSRSRTVNIHAVRNVAVPIMTAIGVSLRFSLSSLPVVELFFAWPGMGLRLLEAIDQRQTVLVVTLAATMGLTFLVINFLLDLFYRIVDPRMRQAA
jgi:peptide/nickel transport system permease protein